MTCPVWMKSSGSVPILPTGIWRPSIARVSATSDTRQPKPNASRAPFWPRWQRLRQFPGLFDEARMQRAINLYEFDDAVTAPIHGFAGADDYWRRASAKPWLKSIAVPALAVNPKNDPFLPAANLPTAADASPLVRLEQPAGGGQRRRRLGAGERAVRHAARGAQDGPREGNRGGA